MRIFGREITNQSHSPSPPGADYASTSKLTLNSRGNTDESKLIGLIENEIHCQTSLSCQQFLLREKTLKWIVAQCRLTLQLRNSTIEHCIRLFDYYTCKAGHFSATLNEVQLTLMACLFISSKYVEIYPPSISDFEYVCKYKFNASEILSRQLQILWKVDFKLTMPLASQWYFGLFGEIMPEWAILCYPRISSNISMKYLAELVYKVAKQRDLRAEKEAEDLENLVEAVVKQVK